MESVCGIYKFTNKYNRKVYIGKSIDIYKRYWYHNNNAKNGIKGYFYNAIRKYGIEGFDFEVLIECSEYNLNYWEKFYIKYYCSNILEYGYNRTDGGDGIRQSGELNGMYGKHHSKDSRLKMSKNYHYHTYERTEEQRKILSEKSKGNKSFSGHQHTKETKEKMRIAAINRKPRHWYLDKETNKRIYY